ncbi:MAG TPA: ribonuclease HI [Spirochaetes bacterium]|nr:ribonuclease HI [Spirochaetota bacterium]
MDDVKDVVIYTDGSSRGNPGPGGYGVVLLYGKEHKELSGGYRLTTNNRMEILAAILGLETLKSRCRVTIYTDSQLLCNSINKGWAERWKEKGWMRNKRDKALNPDLWDRLLGLCGKHDVTFTWVRGHAGNSGNERCDELATSAAQQKDLPVDEFYESQSR